MIKTVWLYDSHSPHNIPLEPLIKYCVDQKINVFGFGGDNVDFGCISHWNDENFKNKGFNQVRMELEADAACFRAQLAQLRKAMPKAKFVYVQGNHEQWAVQFSQKYPQMKKITVDVLCDFKKYGVEMQPYGAFYKLGKLYFCHGDQFGTSHPATQAVMRCQRNVVFGHFHSAEIAPNFSFIDAKERHVAVQVPCYAKLQAPYLHGKSTKWCNGFFYANIKDSGNFSFGIQLVSPEGRFITQAGVEYR